MPHSSRCSRSAGMRSTVLLLLCAVLVPATARAQVVEQEITGIRVLPLRSEHEIDSLLAELEAAYAAMDVDRFVDLFTDDFTQLDVNRGVRVRGRRDWREQTRRINGAHVGMGRRHFGRIWSDPWLIVEIEWSGIVRGEALGPEQPDTRYRYSGVGLIEIRNGRIRRQVMWGDYATLIEQLGSAVTRKRDPRSTTDEVRPSAVERKW